jgi:UDP-N-acetylmuramate dehydrogenase
MLIKQNISLKDFSNFKIGGNAAYFLEVTSVTELTDGLKEWFEIKKDLTNSNEKRIFVLGGGTNVLFADEGFPGLVIKNSINKLQIDGEMVEVGAGTLWADFVQFCIDNSLSGIEWSGGLPGTVGGAIRGNAGAYNGETKDSLIEVKSINLNTLEEKLRTNKECEFSYRNSIYKTGAGEKEIIVSAKFKLTPSDQRVIKAATQEKIDARKLRHPLEYPNVGSIFKNTNVEKFETKQFLYELAQYVKNDPFPVIPTAKLNFLAGLKGKRVGDAQLSEKHTNFIVNLGNASAKDVKELIKIIQTTVKEKFSVDLEPEIMFVN